MADHWLASMNPFSCGWRHSAHRSMCDKRKHCSLKVRLTTLPKKMVLTRAARVIELRRAAIAFIRASILSWASASGSPNVGFSALIFLSIALSDISVCSFNPSRIIWMVDAHQSRGSPLGTAVFEALYSGWPPEDASEACHGQRRYRRSSNASMSSTINASA